MKVSGKVWKGMNDRFWWAECEGVVRENVWHAICWILQNAQIIMNYANHILCYNIAIHTELCHIQKKIVWMSQV